MLFLSVGRFYLKTPDRIGAHLHSMVFPIHIYYIHQYFTLCVKSFFNESP